MGFYQWLVATLSTLPALYSHRDWVTDAIYRDYLASSHPPLHGADAYLQWKYDGIKIVNISSLLVMFINV